MGASQDEHEVVLANAVAVSGRRRQRPASERDPRLPLKSTQHRLSITTTNIRHARAEIDGNRLISDCSDGRPAYEKRTSQKAATETKRSSWVEKVRRQKKK